MSALWEKPVPLALYLVLPAALTAYLSFNSGGYFPGTTAVAALILAAVLAVRAVASDEPFVAISRPVAIAAAALMLYGIWTLISAGWSDSAARSMLEFNRVLLFLLALLVFGSMPNSPERVRWMLWGLALAFTTVCTVGLLTRMLPDVFEIAPSFQTERLSYPIGYWNALGLMAALGIVLCTHLTSSEREPAAVRVLAAAAVPALAVALYFTFSRGAIVAGVVGLLAYAVLARPRALVSGLVALVPTTTVAVVAAYEAELLASREPATAQAVAQGHDVAAVMAVCVGAAALVRTLLLLLDSRLERLHLEPRARWAVIAGGVALAVGAGVIVLAATDLPDRFETQYKRFTRSDLEQTADLRDRLTDPGINRFDHWELALDGFHDHPLRGNGAGTFTLLWDRDRPDGTDSEEAHSLYLEVLAELGLVGLALLATALIALLVGAARRTRGAQRPLYAAVLSLALVWLLAAGVDWAWEVTAVTLWLFALAAAAAAPASQWAPAEGTSEQAGRRVRTLIRGVVVAGCLGLAGTPALVAISQSRLNDAVRAYDAGDCAEAQRKADASLSALGPRAEPYEILGYCSARDGRSRDAIDAMEKAIDRDPGNWKYRYSLALVRAADGFDPRPAIRVARRLNPRDLRVRAAMKGFRGNDPARWKREAAEVRGISRR